ncbi:MAG: Ig-like domain-containing protein, partial [Actinomycetota bacterium]|nr:Ig-like domain-containing protein [Actinomycetota bacterium]
MALATLVGLALAVLPGPARAAPIADPVVRVGTIKVVHEDDFANGRSTRRLVLRADGKDFMLDGVNPDTGPKAGSTVRVAGAQQGSSIEVSGITSLAPPAAAAAPISGQRRIAVVLFNFTNNASRPFTAADALARVFTGGDSANGYYQEASNGALSLVGRNSPAGDVFGWYTIPQTNFTCDQIGWGNAARSSAASDGHDLSVYDNVVYVFPKTTSCSWAGLAYIGGGPYGMGEAWSNGYLDTGVITHELGHNFGMNHASTLTCTVDGRRVTAAEGCVADEYGDQSDVMGNAWAAQHSGSYYGRHPGSWHSLQAGLQPGSALTTISASGDYTLASGETDTGTRSLMVALVNLPGWYYAFDLRTPKGRFDDFPAGAPVVQGVTVRLVSWPWNGSGGIPVNSYLLDATPDTATFDDAAIPVGREFYDPTYGRLAIRVKSVTGGVAVVHADLDLTGTSVLSVDPSATAMGVPLDRNIVVAFSGPVDRSSVEAAFALYQQPSTTIKVPGQFSWDAASTVLTFDPSPYLLPGTPYDVAIGPGALDASARPVVASQRTSFITDGTGPRVLSTDPIAGTTAVPVDQNVMVTFAGPVERNSAQAAFSLQKTGTPGNLGGSFAWNASSTVMTFDPYAKLFEATGYTVS